jgi:peptide/nickel transport system permease protein
MARFVAGRCLQAIPTLFIISIVVFTLMRLAPGDPAVLRFGSQASLPENQPRIEALRREMGLDKPIVVQYAVWLKDAAGGNFGNSLKSNMPAANLVLSKVPVSLELVIGAMAIALLIAFPGGILAAMGRGGRFDRLTLGFTASGLAIPSFWLGLTLILVFSVVLRILPPGGYIPFATSPLDNLQHLLMPSLTLGVFLGATLLRFLRADMIEALGTDYVRTARAKGLARRGVVLGHALHNALIPVLTYAGIEVGSLLGGAVIVEQVFGWSGVGWLTVQSILDRDYTVVQAAVLYIAVALTLTNLMVDIAYALVNPRIRAHYGT